MAIILHKERRYLDPRTMQGTVAYGLFRKGAQKVGFSAAVVTPKEGQSYMRLQYTPSHLNFQEVSCPTGSLSRCLSDSSRYGIMVTGSPLPS